MPIFMLAGVGFYFIALVAVAPAALMEWLLPRISGERLHMQGAQGNFWHGEASDLRVISAGGNARPLGAIKWQALWLPVLRGELAVSLELATAPKVSRGVVALAPGGIHLRNVDATMPASILTEFYPAWKLWQPGGMLELHAAAIGVERGGINGVAEAKWQGASSSLSHLNPFGSYRLSIKDGKLDLATLSGPLRLTGSGAWGAQGLRFEGLAQADAAAQADLQDFMRLFGKQDSSGAYRISIATAR
jgi:hypothetical protein